MDNLTMNPDDYDFSDSKEVQRYIATGQAELLGFLNRIERDFSQVTEIFMKVDIVKSQSNVLLRLDQVTHQYISALIALHNFYQQLLLMVNVETPKYWKCLQQENNSKQDSN